MTAGKSRIAATMAAVLLVSACGGGDGAPTLMNLSNHSNGPDEFSILPTRPLEMPKDFKTLPEPTPGSPNLVDPSPLNDAVVALGGTPGAGASDPALLATTGRYGVNAGIRGELAAEDQAFRERQSPRLFERLFGTSTYHRVYADQSTSSYQELERARAAQAKTPSAPPAGLRDK